MSIIGRAIASGGDRPAGSRPRRAGRRHQDRHGGTDLERRGLFRHDLDERRRAGDQGGQRRRRHRRPQGRAGAPDDQGDPKQGTLVAQRFCDDDAMLAVVAHFNSGVTIPSSDVYNRCGMPQVTNSSNPKVTAAGYQNLFRPIANDFMQGGIPGDYAHRRRSRPRPPPSSTTSRPSARASPTSSRPSSRRAAARSPPIPASPPPTSISRR